MAKNKTIHVETPSDMDAHGVVHTGKLNELITHKSTRKTNGSRRVQLDFSNCPSLAEQHTAHLTDINYLIQKYKPDELAAYIATRNMNRVPIENHDFANEPDLQTAKNIVLQSRKSYEALPDDIKNQFRSHVEFLKFIDNPQNSEKMVKLGLLKQKQIDEIKKPLEATPLVPATPTTP